MLCTGAPQLMIVSDLDNTMVDHKDKHHESLLRFGALWQACYDHDSLLVYSTGRSPDLYAKLREEVLLLTPSVTIMSVGTEIRYEDSMEPDHGWEEELNQGWDREVAVEEGRNLNLKFQADEVISTLTERFKERKLNAKIIYSGGADLDVLSAGAGKGQALAHLLKKLKSKGRAPGNTLVCGDSGNDAELFAVPKVCGVIVGNAMDELRQWHSDLQVDKSYIFEAEERCAAGILEAMQHFNLQPNVSPRDIFPPHYGGSQLSLSTVAHVVVEYVLLMEQWLKGGVANNDDVFGRLKSSLDPNATYIHAYGVITNPYEEIDTLRELYGVKKDKHFFMWVDRIRVEQLSDTTYLARFDKWERSSKFRRLKQSMVITRQK
uniref:Sucrose-phosphatase n=1 Tax=Physcomitrium patens TaxID=3218 RepID=A0A2K1IXF2_PHYPA|nr:hypothetical protein PHYPA_023776 [Physcomitrium patens]